MRLEQTQKIRFFRLGEEVRVARSLDGEHSEIGCGVDGSREKLGDRGSLGDDDEIVC